MNGILDQRKGIRAQFLHRRSDNRSRSLLPTRGIRIGGRLQPKAHCRGGLGPPRPISQAWIQDCWHRTAHPARRGRNTARKTLVQKILLRRETPRFRAGKRKRQPLFPHLFLPPHLLQEVAEILPISDARSRLLRDAYARACGRLNRSSHFQGEIPS